MVGWLTVRKVASKKLRKHGEHASFEHLPLLFFKLPTVSEVISILEYNAEFQEA